MTPTELAQERLTAELRAAADAGVTWPCADVESWTSEDRAEREHASAFCADCPARVFAACAAAGEHETFGVWAGVDRARLAAGRAA